MTILNCGCRSDCVVLSVLGSIILGIIAAFLNFTAVIAVTPAFLWVLFGIAVVYLAILLPLGALSRSLNVRACLCAILPTLLLSILAVVLLSVILLAVTFAAGSVFGAVLVGALVGFFFLLLGSTACLARCIAGCAENDVV